MEQWNKTNCQWKSKKGKVDSVVHLLDATFVSPTEVTDDNLLIDRQKDYFFNALRVAAIAGRALQHIWSG
jgi:hypothetical protein